VKALRVFGLVAAGLTAAIVLVAAAIIGQAEWKVRSATPRAVLPSFEVSSSSRSASTADAPVLILLHGAGLNGRMWDPVRRHLDARWRVIALDLPGHGSRRDEVFTLAASTATVAAAARAMAPAPVVLAGDSLGGYAAMAAASSLPREQLRGLVLAGCSSERESTRVLSYLKNMVMVSVLSALVDEGSFVARALAGLGVSETDRQAIVAAGVSLRAVPFAERDLLWVDFRAKLAAVEQPVLVVNGDLDQGAIGGEAAFLAAARQATSHHFENTGHGVSMRRSADFAALVNGFTARAFSTIDAPKP
jgi:pimeloyl-ACP methyl ester carboxylesterase